MAEILFIFLTEAALNFQLSKSDFKKY